MDTYYTIEEKYLQAVDELAFGESPKALQLLNEIIGNDPLYARAHFQLGKIYYYNIKDYHTAGYHFKTCTELEPLFPDAYFHYLHLVVFLNMEKNVKDIVSKALNVPGVNAAYIHDLLGLFYEKSKQWTGALRAYHQALTEVTGKKHKDDILESITRVQLKAQKANAYQYHFAD